MISFSISTTWTPTALANCQTAAHLYAPVTYFSCYIVHCNSTAMNAPPKPGSPPPPPPAPAAVPPAPAAAPGKPTGELPRPSMAVTDMRKSDATAVVARDSNIADLTGGSESKPSNKPAAVGGPDREELNESKTGPDSKFNMASPDWVSDKVRARIEVRHTHFIHNSLIVASCANRPAL